MPDSKSDTTTASVADTLVAMAEAEFASWLAQQSDAVRAMPEAEQVELWAEGEADV